MSTLLLLAVLVAAEPESPAAVARPTAEAVADAVRASRGRSIPTKQEHLAKLNERLRRLERQRSQVEMSSDRRVRRQILAPLKQDIAKLKAEIRDAEKNWKDPDLESVELEKMEWESLAVGDVGRATLRGARHGYRCLQILGPQSSLVTVIAYGTVRRSNPQPGQLRDRATSSDLTVVHLDRFSTAGMQEGLAVDLECDVVVVGRFTYTAADGSMRTVFSIEEFNPNQPFE